MLQFCNSRHKQVKVSFFSWRPRLDAPLEGFISLLSFWRSKGWLRDSFSEDGTLFPLSPSVLPGWFLSLRPGRSCQVIVFPERCYLIWELNIQHAPGYLWEEGLLGRRAHSECLEVLWSLRSGRIFRPCPRSLFPPSGEAFKEAFLVDGPGGSQEESHGRFRQVSPFRPAYQTEVLSRPRLVLSLGRKWN